MSLEGGFLSCNSSRSVFDVVTGRSVGTAVGGGNFTLFQQPVSVSGPILRAETDIVLAGTLVLKFGHQSLRPILCYEPSGSTMRYLQAYMIVLCL